MRRLDLPQFRDYLWSGLGADTNHVVLTWLCLPYPGSLFAVEFKSAVQKIRAGVIPVNVADASVEEEWEDILAKDASSSEIPSLLTRCRLSGGDKAVLKRVLQRSSRSEKVMREIDGDAVKSSPHLERVKAYLMSLSHPENDGCAQ